MFRPKAVLGHDTRLIIEERIFDPLPEREDLHSVIHELERVIVSCHHDHSKLRICFDRLPRERAYAVVRLIAGQLIDRDIEGPYQFLDPGNLRVQVVRCLGPGRLVGIKLLMAKRGPSEVEGGRDIFRVEFLQNREHRHGEPVDRLNLLAAFGREWRQGVIGTMDEGIAVEEYEDFLGRVSHINLEEKPVSTESIARK